jgi:hypothetical protein
MPTLLRIPSASRHWVARFDASLRGRAESFVRWNVAPMYPGMRTARVFVVSAPKCGRTWLRTLLSAYDGYRAGSSPPKRLDATERKLGVLFSHDRWEHAAAPWPAIVLGRCLIPPDRRESAKIVLMARDPRDAFVSLYFELTRRKRWFSGTMDEMLRHPTFGLSRIVDVMNGWAEEWGGSPRLALLKYEDLLDDPEATFRDFLEFAFGAADRDPLRQAVQFAAFPKMQQLEAEGYFDDAAMRTRDPGDPDAFKVRRGEAGTHAEYLSNDAVGFARHELTRLDPIFGYTSA